jgi:hypothetical protein
MLTTVLIASPIGIAALVAFAFFIDPISGHFRRR